MYSIYNYNIYANFIHAAYLQVILCSFQPSAAIARKYHPHALYKRIYNY